MQHRLYSFSEIVDLVGYGKMGLLKCTQSFFENVPDVVPGVVPLQVLEDCIFSKATFNDLISLNSTACVSSVEKFESDISYACTYHFLSSNYTGCYQFYHTHGNLYDSHRCYTVGEQLQQLFAVSPNTLDIVVFVLSLMFYFFIMFKVQTQP